MYLNVYNTTLTLNNADESKHLRQGRVVCRRDRFDVGDPCHLRGVAKGQGLRRVRVRNGRNCSCLCQELPERVLYDQRILEPRPRCEPHFFQRRQRGTRYPDRRRGLECDRHVPAHFPVDLRRREGDRARRRYADRRRNGLHGLRADRRIVPIRIDPALRRNNPRQLQQKAAPALEREPERLRSLLSGVAYSFLQVISSNIRQPSPNCSFSIPPFRPNSFSPIG